MSALVLYRVSAFLWGNWYLSGWPESKSPVPFFVVYIHASAKGRDLSLPATACSFISCCHVTVALARSLWKRRFADMSVQLNCSSCSRRIPHCTLYFPSDLGEAKCGIPVLKPGVTDPLWFPILGICSCQHNSDNRTCTETLDWPGRLSLPEQVSVSPAMLPVGSSAGAFGASVPCAPECQQLLFGDSSLLLSKWCVWDRWSMDCSCQQWDGEHINNSQLLFLLLLCVWLLPYRNQLWCIWCQVTIIFRSQRKRAAEQESDECCPGWKVPLSSLWASQILLCLSVSITDWLFFWLHNLQTRLTVMSDLFSCVAPSTSSSCKAQLTSCVSKVRE